MSAIIILVACSLLVAVGFLIAFIISSTNGQFDDVETPAMRMLYDNTVSGNSAARLLKHKRRMEKQAPTMARTDNQDDKATLYANNPTHINK